MNLGKNSKTIDCIEQYGEHRIQFCILHELQRRMQKLSSLARYNLLYRYTCFPWSFLCRYLQLSFKWDDSSVSWFIFVSEAKPIVDIPWQSLQIATNMNGLVPVLTLFLLQTIVQQIFLVALVKIIIMNWIFSLHTNGIA